MGSRGPPGPSGSSVSESYWTLMFCVTNKSAYRMKHQTWCHVNLCLFLLSSGSSGFHRPRWRAWWARISCEYYFVFFCFCFVLGSFCNHVRFSSILATRCTSVYIPLLCVPLPVVLSHWHPSHSVLKGHFDFLGSHGSSRFCWPPWKERRWCKKLIDHLLYKWAKNWLDKWILRKSFSFSCVMLVCCQSNVMCLCPSLK